MSGRLHSIENRTVYMCPSEIKPERPDISKCLQDKGTVIAFYFHIVSDLHQQSRESNLIFHVRCASFHRTIQ